MGAPWPKYVEAAARNGMQVIRIPMIEGSCPNSIEEIDAVIQTVSEKIRLGENVLTHCRGGKHWKRGEAWGAKDEGGLMTKKPKQTCSYSWLTMSYRSWPGWGVCMLLASKKPVLSLGRKSHPLRADTA